MDNLASSKCWKECARLLFKYVQLMNKSCRVFSENDEELAFTLAERAKDCLDFAKKFRVAALRAERGC